MERKAGLLVMISELVLRDIQEFVKERRKGSLFEVQGPCVKELLSQ